MSSIRPAGFVFTFGVLLIMGCGGPSVPGSSQVEKVSAVASSLNDAAGDEVTFKSIFVSGKAPEDRSRYFSSSIQVIGIPVIEGEQAMVTMKVTQGAAESEGKDKTKNEEVASGEVTWTLKKDGADWKIQDAPLPQ